MIFINTFDFQGASYGNRNIHTSSPPSPISRMWVSQCMRLIYIWFGKFGKPSTFGWLAHEDGGLQRVVLRRVQAYLGFIPDATIEHGHILWAAGLVGTLKAAVKMRHALHLDRTRLSSAGPSRRGILRSQCGT